jgi:hypothetical protein
VARAVASALTGGENGYHIAAVEDVYFHAPLKFYRNEPRAFTWRAALRPAGEDLVAQVSLESTRALKTGTRHTCHFTGRVALAAGENETDPPPADAPTWADDGAITPEAIYAVYFHGPAFQVLDGVQGQNGGVIGRWKVDLPPVTAEPAELLAMPLLIELCMQTAGVWEIGKTGTLALPTAIDRVVVYRIPPAGAALYACVEPRQDERDELKFDARVVDGEGQLCLELEGYRTARLSAPVDEALVSPLRAAVEE